MEIIILYTVIVLIATISGAIAGLGGGVIIKPLFDLIGFHNASTISFYSSIAVFTMCLVSIYKQLKNKFKFDLKIVLAISIGSLVGGFLGESIFNLITKQLSDNFVKIVQRLPVKIEFVQPQDNQIGNLPIGLNVLVDVLIDSLIIK